MSRWAYLPFLLVWALPVIALQWLAGWRILWRERRTWPWVVLGLGAYFTLADAVAIAARIWSFDPRSLVGLYLGPVPIEEAFFYLLTATMVVQGFVLFWHALRDRDALRTHIRRRIGQMRARLARPTTAGGNSRSFDAASSVTRQSRRALARRRHLAGVWAALLALAPAFVLAALLAVPTPLEPLVERIMLATPVPIANVLVDALGPLAGTFGLLGGIACALAAGGALALLAPTSGTPLPKPGARFTSALRSPWALRWLLTGAVALLLAAPLALAAPYPGAAASALLAGLLYAPALALALRLVILFDRAFDVRRGGRGMSRPDTTEAQADRPDVVRPSAVAPAFGAATQTPSIAAPTTVGARHVAPHADASQETPARYPSDPATPVAAHPSRRAFLRGAAVSAATVAGALALGSFEWWSGAVAAVTGRADAARTLFRFVAPGPRRAGFPVAGVEPEVTPVARFYLLSKNDVDPLVVPADWSLSITGAVRRDLRLTYADLLAAPRIDQYVTLRCVSNPVDGRLMSTAYWSGASLADLLHRAGPDPSADVVLFHAPDAYEEALPLDAAVSPAALLAYGMNGQSLARHHGGPVRALLPGFFGFKNVKWVEAITVQAGIPRDFWTNNGWTATQVHPAARIDVWRPAPGGLLVAGVAFAGTRGVSAVQVRADGGAWHDCALNVPALSPLTWVQWRIVQPLAPGAHTLTARLIDASGQPQDATDRGIFPGGATGLHTVHLTV